ncbi:MAG: Glu-tRNA(Gln) amidotransferase subunit GatD [Nanoarchaeota archaeon]|nr:Glu-tRNA(Gln) amidotransferase subunit GatD [Nanoarchaeota archaeon]
MKTNASPGDFVEVHLTKLIYEGTLLESPDSKIVLIKLGTGYNLGLNKKEINEIKVLKKTKEFQEHSKMKADSKKPNIAMVITGGTIASRYDPKTGAVKWLTNPENLFKFYPELFEKVNVLKVDVPFMKGSENMDFKDWKKIAKSVETFLNDKNIQGIIVTHGTDTLHYTSAALSFFLGKINKPVVLTYSQRSIDRASSDANLNLQCSALAAISDIAEVMIVGHANSDDDFCYALPGTKVRKMHSSRRDAFKAINERPIAKIYPDILEKISEYSPRGKSNKIKVDSNFEEKVALLKFYPGQDPNILDYYVKEGYKGLVIEMVGLGHVATSESRNSWTNKLKEVIKKGLVVCAAPQTLNGRLDPLVYSTGRELIDTGVIYLKDILPETALVKLGWVLGHKNWNAKEKMLENISGEFNDRLEE